jgi:phospholipid/cholesterol/gamma-HCH transport system permease protein
VRLSVKVLETIEDTAVGALLDLLGGIATLISDAAKSLRHNRPTLSSIIHELYQVGVMSFVIVMVATLATGLVMSMQFGFGLARFGAKLYVPKVLSTSIFRELGPIFTALMMAGRVGAGISAEVGSMKVTQQIDAIRALGTNPLQKIVTPKIIATTIACPLLTIFGNFFGILGGLIISNSQLAVSGHDFFFKAFEVLTIRDVCGGIFKAIFFGFIIGAIGCYSGLNTSGGTQGVGNATTKAVVTSSILILLSDFILTKFLWIIQMGVRGGSL